MSVWAEVFLGIIAVATLVTAVMQIAVLVAAGMAVRRTVRLLESLDREIKPIAAQVHAMARDAAHVTALAAAQVERADRLFSEVAESAEKGLTSLQAGLLAPLREGRALMEAFKVGLRTILDVRGSGRPRQGRAEDEDALFI